MNRPPYNPFQNLNDLKDLKSLTNHILNSLKVEEVRAVLPDNFDKELIYAPGKLPVDKILVGDATFEYIQHKVGDIMGAVKNQIRLTADDSTRGFADKALELSKIRKDILSQFQYFDTMNPIRYMSSFIWKISITTH